jgi:2,4-dienoyl-CoA reductase-like NADH-dependent reductase (Old Yellow Enzyme family)
MSELFSPLTIRDVTLRNRVVLPPMVRFTPSMSPEVTNTGGEITPAVIEYYRQRAAGMGMVVVEATCIDPGGRTWADGLNAYADEHLPGLVRLAWAIRREGCVACVQIVHGGPQASPELVGQTVGPSSVRPSAAGALPRELTVAELGAIQQHFVDGAARLADAGFQAVDLHGAHGYLLDSFLSRARNNRTDRYGGDVVGRSRMLAETLRRVVDKVRGRILVGCRFSLFNKLPGEFGITETQALVRELEGAGADFLDVSTGGVFKGWFETVRTIGQWIRGMTELPVIVAGELVTPQDAERAIAEGHGDMAAVGRATLTEPDWAGRARTELCAA